MAAAFPFLTTYDPPGTSEGSLDPLGLYQIADQLAMQLVPAVRERMLRIRFLTAMAVSSLVIEDLEGDPRHPDATPYLVWEWLVVEALTREMGDDPSIRGVPGTGVTRATLAQHKYVDARSYGASAIDDGCDAVDSPLSNCSNIPVEAIDMEHDFFRVVEYALVRGSGGKGEYRGGLGMRRVYEVLTAVLNTSRTPIDSRSRRKACSAARTAARRSPACCGATRRSCSARRRASSWRRATGW